MFRLTKPTLTQILTSMLVAVAVMTMSGCKRTSDPGDMGNSNVTICPTGEAQVTNGYRRLALIVGIGDYASEDVPDLYGTVADAQSMYDLLTGPDGAGYGFPKQNVCLLLQEQATGKGFRKAFDEVLVRRAQPDDVAVVYFAGHGSQLWDRNGDEPDQWDETLVFHDALSSETGEIVDDDFHEMLRALHARTHNVVAILDSCNSGTATRSASGLRARFVPPTDRTVRINTAGPGDGASGWEPRSLPGLVTLTAASDGTPALEKGAKGIFTDALVQVMSQVSEQPLTYAQIARQVPPLVASSSYQIPFFQGELNQAVFGNTGRTRPIGWDVASVGPPLRLSGPPLPGFGVGAELRLYDGAASGNDVKDPGKAKAVAIVDEMTGLNAVAHVTGTPPDAAAVAAGDLAMLVRPANEFLRLKVRIRSSDVAGGVPEERARSLLALYDGDDEAKLLVDFVDADEEFELSLAPDGRLLARGPENRVRIIYERDGAAIRNLWQHARQRALLRLQGEGGDDFTDQETLQVQLVQAGRQPDCARGEWSQADPNTEQIIPLCRAWHIKVALAADAGMPLHIGGLILSTDGAVFGFPADGRPVILQPGADVTIKTADETFYGAPPLDVQDHVLVFGTQLTNPVQWHLLSETAKTRSADRGFISSGLHGALHRYLQPGKTRGVKVLSREVENTTWTMSSLALRVESSDRFARIDWDAPPTTREYTLGNFDIRPYLPLDHTSALFKVLSKADKLARSSVTDGYGYEQHDWSAPGDAENLAIGIDCSRAIWFAFTRSGLPYNEGNCNDEGNCYIATADMVGEQSIMTDRFAQCPQRAEYRTGDVLVYRSDARKVGHVVMVVDPQKRIAWGSHGWDGSPRDAELPIDPDTGVEYQLIKYKRDWQRWDRADMELKSCWRYRRFAEEAEAGIDSTRMWDTDPCAEDVCPLRET